MSSETPPSSPHLLQISISSGQENVKSIIITSAVCLGQVESIRDMTVAKHVPEQVSSVPGSCRARLVLEARAQLQHVPQDVL